MRTEIVDCETKEQALNACPWACDAVEVDSGEGGKAWKCFESIVDLEAWQSQA